MTATDPTPDQLLDTLHNWRTEEGATDATMLTTVIEAAALDLAGELHTANLIALLDVAENSGTRTAFASALWREIVTRLGLENLR